MMICTSCFGASIVCVLFRLAKLEERWKIFRSILDNGQSLFIFAVRGAWNERVGVLQWRFSQWITHSIAVFWTAEIVCWVLEIILISSLLVCQLNCHLTISPILWYLKVKPNRQFQIAKKPFLFCLCFQRTCPLIWTLAWMSTVSQPIRRELGHTLPSTHLLEWDWRWFRRLTVRRYAHTNYTITERIPARSLVESYGRWKHRP